MEETILEQAISKLGEHRQSGKELIFQTCPFCGDSRSHLYVNRNTVQYYCHKCNSGGGYYTLAKKLGLQLSEKSQDRKSQEIKELAFGLFADLLKDDPTAEGARKWLEERGINRKWLDAFETGKAKVKKRLPIGFHPGDDMVMKHFENLGYTAREQEKAGILLSTLKEHTGSIVFINHLRQDMIGRFMVRKVKGTSKEVAWLGKGQKGVFCLGLFDSSVHKDMIGVEGEFDALAMQVYMLEHENITTNVVGLHGGSAGPDVDALARNGIKKLRLIPDNDDGGYGFVLKCSEGCRKHNIACIVHQIPEEHNDPDDWMQSGQVDLKAVYKNDLLPGTYLAQNTIKYDDKYIQPDLNSLDGMENARQYIADKAKKLDGRDMADFAQAFPENIAPIIQKPTVRINTGAIITSEPIDARTLIEMEIEDPPMMIGHGLLPCHGYSMLASYTKTGKTTLAIQMCLSIVSGTDLLGFPIEKQSKVLYCHLEMPKAGMSKLIREQVAGWGSPIEKIENLHLWECRGLCLEDKSGMSSLKEKIENVDTDLVVIDPVSLAMSKDMNDIATIRSFVGKLQQIGAAMDISWFLVHHYGKATMQKRPPIQSMLGSSGWGNFTESFIGMDRYSERRSPDYRKLSFDLRWAPQPQDMCLYLNPSTRLFEVIEDPENIPAISTDRVVDVLASQDRAISYTLLTTLVKDKLEVSERSAKSLVQAAKDSGKIAKGEGKFGKYFIP